MTQHAYTIADQPGLAFLADVNEALAAIVTNNSGAEEPVETYSHMWWADTTAGILKRRNAADNAWIAVMSLDLAISDFGESLIMAADAAAASAAIGAVRLTGDETKSGVLTLPDGAVVGSLNGGQLAGFRNLIINGNFNINQRGYVSGTATTVANQYTQDRWRIVTSGQSATFAASGNGNQVTAPAGGMEQVIEGANIGGGTYTLGWTGTATATVNGVACLNGGNVTLPANTNATIKFSSGTVSKVQVEPGTVAAPFEQRSVGMELMLCQRYYWRGLPGLGYHFPSYSNSSVMSWAVPFPQVLRAIPTVSINTDGITLSNTGTPTVGLPTTYGVRLLTTSTAVNNNTYFTFATGNYIAADAEL